MRDTLCISMRFSPKHPKRFALFEDVGVPPTKRFDDGEIPGTRTPRFDKGGIKTTIPKTSMFGFYGKSGKIKKKDYSKK